MPNRYVREGAIESEAVNRLSWQGEVFYRRLINRVDDFGRFTANKQLLLAHLFPLQTHKVHVADIAKLLLECEKAGLISVWKGDDGKEYMAMHKWEQGRARTSRFPDPPANIRLQMQTDVYSREHLQTDVPDSDTDSDSDTDTDNPVPQNWDAWMATPEFLTEWKAWHKARKQKPTEVQFKKLERLSGGVLQIAIAIVRESAENGWKGLFPLKGTNGTHRQSRAQRLDADAEQLLRDLGDTPEGDRSSTQTGGGFPRVGNAIPGKTDAHGG